MSAGVTGQIFHHVIRSVYSENITCLWSIILMKIPEKPAHNQGNQDGDGLSEEYKKDFFSMVLKLKQSVSITVSVFIEIFF